MQLQLIETSNELKTRSGAVFSDDGKHRFKLWRTWNVDKPKVLFIMLNPSTADANTNDKTVSKCIKLAKAWHHYGGIIICNLYSFCATKPKDLVASDTPVHPDNARYVAEMVKLAKIVVMAWGNPTILKKLPYSDAKSIQIHKDKMYYLYKCQDGTPGHPLYLPNHTKPQPITK